MLKLLRLRLGTKQFCPSVYELVGQEDHCMGEVNNKGVLESFLYAKRPGVQLSVCTVASSWVATC